MCLKYHGKILFMSKVSFPLSLPISLASLALEEKLLGTTLGISEYSFKVYEYISSLYMFIKLRTELRSCRFSLYGPQ